MCDVSKVGRKTHFLRLDKISSSFDENIHADFPTMYHIHTCSWKLLKSTHPEQLPSFSRETMISAPIRVGQLTCQFFKLCPPVIFLSTRVKVNHPRVLTLSHLSSNNQGIYLGMSKELFTLCSCIRIASVEGKVDNFTASYMRLFTPFSDTPEVKPPHKIHDDWASMKKLIKSSLSRAGCARHDLCATIRFLAQCRLWNLAS